MISGDDSNDSNQSGSISLGYMSYPLIQTLIGDVNGTNLYFETPADYRPGSVHVFRNGMVLRGDLGDGWTELGGRKIRLNSPPKVTDVMRAYYIPI